MEFRDINDKELTEFFLSEPQLVLLGMPDEEMIYLHEHKEFKCGAGSYFVEILGDNGESLGVIRWEFFTPISIVVHMFLRHKYHHSTVLKDIYQFIYRHLLENTKVRKMIAFITSSCIHVVKAAEKLGFTKNGSIPNCLVWRNEVVGLDIYSVDIKEGQ